MRPGQKSNPAALVFGKGFFFSTYSGRLENQKTNNTFDFKLMYPFEMCLKCNCMLLFYRRGLNPPHRVKSISMASFTPEEMDFLKCHGNDVSNIHVLNVLEIYILLSFQRNLRLL